MKLILYSLIFILAIFLPIQHQAIQANHSMPYNYSKVEVKHSFSHQESSQPIYPQKPKKKKKNKNNNKKDKLQVKYNSFLNILLAAIGIVIFPLGVALELPWLWIVGAIILSLFFILTIIKMIKTRQLSYEGAEGIKKNKILLLTSTFLTLLGISLLVTGIVGNILALWIIGAIIILPGIVWIIRLSCKSGKS